MSSTDLSTDATAAAAVNAPPTRHARVWLNAALWRDRLKSPLDGRCMTEIDRWIARGNALVARRRDAGAALADCFLGVALPLRADRLRIALVVDREAVARVDRPLRLDEIVDVAPGTHRVALAALLRRSEAVDTNFHVYGSFAWQAISGEACVTLHSDIDLLWEARAPDHVERVIDLLCDWEAEYGLRADGEVRFGNGDAVAWRELRASAERVLVKRDDGILLAPRSRLLARP